MKRLYGMMFLLLLTLVALFAFPHAQQLPFRSNNEKRSYFCKT